MKIEPIAKAVNSAFRALDTRPITKGVVFAFGMVIARQTAISGLHIAYFHPYLSAAFVAVCLAVYFMSGGE